MKILLGIFILLTIYYFILFFFVFKGSWQSVSFFRKKNKNDIIGNISIENIREQDIVGKSKTYLFEIAEAPELELDLDIEYPEELQEEDLNEEAIELEELGFSEYSTGVTYEELLLTVDVVQNENVPDELESEATGIISTMGQADMFELLLQFSGAGGRVTDLMKKHVDHNL